MIGNKGMTGAKRFFLNLVPEKVVDLTDRDVLVARTIAQVASELEPGEGGILVQAGERLAAFMDGSGELHLMSARCTHMGCTVAWNTADHVFECPCHGSRFGPMGEVVNGPAARPLPPGVSLPAQNVWPGFVTISQMMMARPPTPIAVIRCAFDERTSSPSSSSLVRGTPEGRIAHAAEMRLK